MLPQCLRDGCLPSCGQLAPLLGLQLSCLQNVPSGAAETPRGCCLLYTVLLLTHRWAACNLIATLCERPICCLQVFEYPADLFVGDEDEDAFSTASIFGEDDTEVEDDADFEDDRSTLFVPDAEDQAAVDSSLAAAILGALTPRELATLDSQEEPAQVSGLKTCSHCMLHAFVLH